MSSNHQHINKYVFSVNKNEYVHHDRFIWYPAFIMLHHKNQNPFLLWQSICLNKPRSTNKKDWQVNFIHWLEFHHNKIVGMWTWHRHFNVSSYLLASISKFDCFLTKYFVCLRRYNWRVSIVSYEQLFCPFIYIQLCILHLIRIK